MTEKERFEFTMNDNGQAGIIDWVESKEKNAFCIYTDLGAIPFTSAKAVCNKLNEQEERIRELEKELKQFEPTIFKYGYGEAILYIKTDGDVE